jgi:hypothetical protein
MIPDFDLKLAEKIRKQFEAMRNDPRYHLGLGDIRVTIGHQDELCDMIQTIEKQYIDSLERYCEDLMGEDL